ncbi:MAG TPA: fatty acid desaturase [Gammaproteobacteria bacterium]|nr:fatty acid desaturase [Gammaproteobacteria bacterium]
MFSQKLFHHPVDKWQVIATLVTASLQFTAFLMIDSFWLACLASLALSPLFAMSIAFGHNQHHRNTMSWMPLNRFYEVLLYFQNGTSPYAWTLHHNVGHHAHYLDHLRDPSAWKTEDGRVMGRWEYCVKNSLMLYPSIVKIGLHFPQLLRKFLIMFALSNAILAILFYFDPVNALVLYVIPMISMVFFLLDATYPHHAQLDTVDPVVASRNNLNPFFNFITCNLGYHAAHHIDPELHWTELPEAHAKIANRIPPELNHHTFIWRPEALFPKQI